MPHMIRRFRFLSFATLAARLVAFVPGVAMTVLLASSGPRAVNAQQTAPATAPDSQSAAQAPPAQPPASDQAPQATPAPPPVTTPETAPAPPADNQPSAPAPNNSQQPSPQQPSADHPPQPTPAPPPETQPSPAATPSAPAHSSQPAHAAEPNEISEEEIKSLLVGKQLFLRGGYLDNDLSYNENGVLVSHSPQGSYTLSAIQIDKVHLTKHKLELEGERYGLHFLGALPYEDPTKAVDRVNITPKKKIVKITIDRELVVKPKEKKEKPEKGKPVSPAPKTAATPAPTTAPTPNAVPATAPPTAAAETASATDNQEAQAAAQAEIASAPAAERPADAKSVTTTTSQAHSNKLLSDALDNVFAQPFDSRMMESMPGFWKLYYAAAATKTDYRPSDPAVLRQSEVDKKARLTSTFEPQSNEFAQDHGVAGICLYHVVIGADGRPGEIAVARPIGFGLDENAVDSIRKATFEPAIKNGNPVPVMLDLVVEFRIYSNRTAVTANPAQQPPAAPSLPGPYSTQQPQKNP